ncbi:MAG: flagellar brake protein [Butyrivibrio sp.]|nr:flagellar brake protein [Butyrivibrio sp.]
MLADYIAPGNKIELKAIGKVWMDEDSRTKKIHLSKITDIISDDRIEVLMPMDKGKLVLLPVDGEYNLCFYSQRGLFQCYGRIVDRYRSNNVYILVLDLLSNLQRMQRREYYRFSCALELKSRIFSEEEVEAIRRNWGLVLGANKPLQRSVIVDISGGGLRFVANFQYEEGSTIYCSYRLPGNNNNVEYEMVCNVLRVQELENRPGLYEHRIQYSYIDESSREDIIHFIFEEERKIRKKQN